MTVYIHKDKVINIEAMNDFILLNSERMQVFGKPKRN